MEYTVSTGMKIFYGLLAIGMFVFSVFLVNVYNPSVTHAVLLFPLFLTAGAVLIIVNLIKRGIVIDDHSILCNNLFSRKELEFTRIKGCRIGQKAIYIEPLSSDDPTIVIGNYSDLTKSDELARWVKAHFKDLDSIDLEKERQELSQNPELGSTEAERQGTLKRAKNIAITYNIAGIALSFAMIFYNAKTGTIILLSYPLIGVMIMIFSKGIIKFISKAKRSVYPSISLGMALPSFLLLIKSLGEYSIFQSNHLWSPALIISGILFALFYFRGINKSIGSIKGQIAFMLILALLYGFGSALQINCAFDNSPLKTYDATVFSRRMQNGRSRSYFLTLSPWGPRRKVQETEVHRRLYNVTAIGDTVKVNFKEGLLHVPWFIVTRDQEGRASRDSSLIK